MSLTTFFDAVLQDVNINPTPQDVSVLSTMAAGESSGYLLSQNNPLASTQLAPGSFSLPGSAFSSGVNSANVQGYSSPASGEQATAATLSNGNYPALLNNLRTSAPNSAYAPGTAAAKNLITWQGGSTEDVTNISGQSSGPPQARGVSGQLGGTGGNAATGSNTITSTSPSSNPFQINSWFGSIDLSSFVFIMIGIGVLAIGGLALLGANISKGGATPVPIPV